MGGTNVNDPLSCGYVDLTYCRLSAMLYAHVTPYPDPQALALNWNCSQRAPITQILLSALYKPSLATQDGS